MRWQVLILIDGPRTIIAAFPNAIISEKDDVMSRVHTFTFVLQNRLRPVLVAIVEAQVFVEGDCVISPGFCAVSIDTKDYLFR